MLKQNLISFHIIEREAKQNLITWTYPKITEDIKKYIISRCFPVSGLAKNDSFFYLRSNYFWIYIKRFTIKHNNQGGLAVIAEDFVPTKYKMLCDIFIRKYTKTMNPVDLVKLYLKLITTGTATFQKNGTEVSLNLKNYIEDIKIKDLVKMFGLETILIYNAVLLRRRIIIYHDEIEYLQQQIRAVTMLVSNINPNQYLMPVIGEINEIKGYKFYLAGTTEGNMENYENYYDLFVNLARNEIKISAKAKEYFVMTSFHKDLAHYMVELSESDLSDKRIVEEINSKTVNTLDLLKSMATCVIENKKMMSMEDLNSKNLNLATKNFLFNLAVAENIMIL